jgi:CRISPR/Cas system-associated exonuclease Cas4 (RecB family)
MQTELWRECEDALDQIDLVRLLSRYGNFEKIEGDLIGTCPYHDDFRKSLVVKLKSKTFHCVYPKCNKHGSIIQLIATFEKLDLDAACAKILKQVAVMQPLIQETLSLVDQSVDQKQQLLPEYSQTKLRTLQECPLRYWNEYVRGVSVDQQTIENTIGTLIHSVLQEFYGHPQASKQQSDLTLLFKKGWKKGRGPQDEREYWFEKASMALQNAYFLNVDSNPIKSEVEITKSTTFPFNNPRYKLKSKADRVDWYSNLEYCLIDYKWDEKTLTEEEATNNFQTIFYYLTWTANTQGLPPKRISYQFLTPGIQVDVTPTETTMESGVKHLIYYIEKAERLMNLTTEPEATQNKYCYNCKLNGTCPATKGLAVGHLL